MRFGPAPAPVLFGRCSNTGMRSSTRCARRRSSAVGGRVIAGRVAVAGERLMLRVGFHSSRPQKSMSGAISSIPYSQPSGRAPPFQTTTAAFEHWSPDWSAPRDVQFQRMFQHHHATVRIHHPGVRVTCWRSPATLFHSSRTGTREFMRCPRRFSRKRAPACFDSLNFTAIFSSSPREYRPTRRQFGHARVAGKRVNGTVSNWYRMCSWPAGQVSPARRELEAWKEDENVRESDRERGRSRVDRRGESRHRQAHRMALSPAPRCWPTARHSIPPWRWRALRPHWAWACT